MPTLSEWHLVLGSASIAICANLTYMLGITMTTAVFVGITAVLQIPFSMGSDVLLHKIMPTPMEAGGCALILAAFILLVVLPSISQATNTDTNTDTGTAPNTAAPVEDTHGLFVSGEKDLAVSDQTLTSGNGAHKRESKGLT